MLELVDPGSGARAELAPARGALVTRFNVAGRDVLFLDEATFRDPTVNVRGGVPVLFPSPGRLQKDAWSRNGRSGSMKQHGFARQLPWEVVSNEASRATLRLRASSTTLAQYPWDFEAFLEFSVRGDTLRLDQRITNHGPEPMPFGIGFHPYFLVPDGQKGAAEVVTDATRAFDNAGKREVRVSKIDLTLPEVDLHLLDHHGPKAELRLPLEQARIIVEGSPEFSRWVVWTLAGRDFVCLEPWTCPGNALNTGERLLELPPGQTRELWMSIRCTVP